MRSDIIDEFLFDPNTIQLNHASYGTPTRATWDRISRLRRDLELDAASHLGSPLVPRLAEVGQTVQSFLGLTGGQLAFTLNTTEGHETVTRSLVASRRAFSAALRDDEYESMQTTWLVEAKRRSNDISVTIHDEPLSGLNPTPDVSIVSVVASSTARLADPAEAAASWASVVDASHGPGHLDLAPWAFSRVPTAIVGSLHKWLPAVRPVGFLWLRDDWPTAIHPAIASLRDAASPPLELLSWRGTWDPTPHLAIPTAIAQWIEWRDAGLVAAAESLAEASSAAIQGIGLAEWNVPISRAPRLRAFVVQNVGVGELKGELVRAGINAWVGLHLDRTIIRLAFNVYNDPSDIERVVDVLSKWGSRS